MRRLLALLALGLPLGASAAGFERVTPLPGHGSLGLYSNAPANPSQAVLALHGHPRDAQRTFEATEAAVAPNTLVLAPLFQVGAEQAGRCQTPGEPGPQAGDLLWRCGSWLAGGPAANDPGVTAFAAIDGLLAQTVQRWPSVKTITVAGFSAGAQWVQHYIAFAHAPAGVQVRFVVAAPGSWLYLDPWRPAPATACASQNRWKYGLEQLPGWLGSDAAKAATRYRSASVQYLVGALDEGDSPGAHGAILDRSCAAMAQGPWRLQRAQGFSGHVQQPLQVVPGCAHDVRCVFTSPQGRQALGG